MKKLNITKDKFTESKDMVNETSGIVTCVWCGDEVYEHETELVDGEVVCRNCANEMLGESEDVGSGYDLTANGTEISDELKTIIEEYIYAEVDSSNEVDGFTSHYSSMNSMRDMFDMKKTLRDENIMIMGDSVFKNDEKIAEIHRNYSSRRVRLCYKQLRPEIIWL